MEYILQRAAKAPRARNQRDSSAAGRPLGTVTCPLLQTFRLTGALASELGCVRSDELHVRHAPSHVANQNFGSDLLYVTYPW